MFAAKNNNNSWSIFNPSKMSLLSPAIILSILFILGTALQRRISGRKLPPGPLGLPIIGHLHMLGRFPHQTLHHLAQKHGPIMSIQLGLKRAVILSSPRAVELFIKNHDANFPSRPKIKASEVLLYGSTGVIFSEYGPYWRSMRKLCTLELLTPTKIEQFKEMRREEVGRLVERMKAASGTLIDVSDEVACVMEDMASKMVFGKCSDERFDLKNAMREVVDTLGIVSVADYLPFLGPFDIQGVTRRLKALHKKIDEILEIIVDEHEHEVVMSHSKRNDFIDVMLSLKNKSSKTSDESSYTIEREHIKAVILDMIVASLESSSISINWAMSELLRNPKVMKKLQEELKKVIGENKMVEEADLAKLKYLNMVIKETLRLHHVAPLLPRECINDITIDGYFIPKYSRIMVNTWTIGRDKDVWTSNADEFVPERFVESEIDVKGQSFQLLPFGTGRRGCPGMTVGMANIRLVLAQLVHCFEWELPEGTSPSELDMSEKSGMVPSRAKHILATPTYRLHV